MDGQGRGMCVPLAASLTTDPVQQYLRFEWLPHATAVYSIVPDGIAKQVWTASGDNSALLSSFNPREPSESPKTLRRIEHPYFVKTVLPLTLYSGQIEGDGIILTGSTDETIRVFDADIISEPSPSTLKAVEAQPTGWKPAVKAGDEKPVRAEGLLQEIEAHAHEVNGCVAALSR